MREIIKFRAWYHNGVNKDKGDMQYGVAVTNSLALCVDTDGVKRWTNCAEIMQYTGLKDKNGKECYWDDWVRDGINPKFLVTPDYHLLARLSEIEFEIVGNKYEQPD